MGKADKLDFSLRGVVISQLSSGREDEARKLLVNAGFTLEDVDGIIEELRPIAEKILKVQEEKKKNAIGGTVGKHGELKNAVLSMSAAQKQPKPPKTVQYEPPSLPTPSMAAVRRRHLSPANIIFATLLGRLGPDVTREVMYRLIFRLIGRGENIKVRNFFLPLSPEGDYSLQGWYRKVVSEVADDLKWSLAEVGRLEDFDSLMESLKNVKVPVLEIKEVGGGGGWI